MKDYFDIKGPAIISFSGGRTSGYMLKKILDSKRPLSDCDIHVVFCNTGKELPETLDFVNECSVKWGVPIIWLEYCDAEKAKNRWKIVTYETASRHGEPFEALIQRRKYLPNIISRFCTSEMKVIPAKKYAQQVLGFKEWDVVIGFRADEPRRVSKLTKSTKEPFDRIAPLAKAGIYNEDIQKFWKNNDFDLKLPVVDGKTVGGNCDLCFLKGEKKSIALIKDRPHIVDWWIKQENQIRSDAHPSGFAKFRNNNKSYEMVKQEALIVHNPNQLFDMMDDIEECNCTD